MKCQHFEPSKQVLTLPESGQGSRSFREFQTYINSLEQYEFALYSTYKPHSERWTKVKVPWTATKYRVEYAKRKDDKKIDHNKEK